MALDWGSTYLGPGGIGSNAGGFLPTETFLPPTDQGAYYAFSPGGRFPGDTYFWSEVQEGLRHLERHQADPSYQLPEWVTRNRGLLGWIGRAHEQNVQQHGGVGGVGNPLAGGGGHLYSGPFASYGPPGGPLHGLLDRGNAGIFDAPETPGLGGGGGGTSGDGGGGGGGRGPYTGPTGPPMAQTSPWQSSFVAWNPGGPPRMVPGAAFSPGPATPQRPGSARSPNQGSSGRPSRGGGSGNSSRPGASSGGGPASSASRSPGAALDAVAQILSQPGGLSPGAGRDLREQMGSFAGYDVNRIQAEAMAGAPVSAELGSVVRGPSGYHFAQQIPTQVGIPYYLQRPGGGADPRQATEFSSIAGFQIPMLTF
ncbi:MAG TPA: hypothetical protein DEH78_19045 [Solibacterales bacterium]|nr:hypothetical protein [Bryobacterales bacterium]